MRAFIGCGERTIRQSLSARRMASFGVHPFHVSPISKINTHLQDYGIVGKAGIEDVRRVLPLFVGYTEQEPALYADPRLESRGVLRHGAHTKPIQRRVRK